MPEAALDAPVLKEIGEAVRALNGLHKALGSAVARPPVSIPPARAKALAVKVHKYMQRYAPITKITGSKLFDALSPEAQEGVKWVDEVIAELMKQEAALRAAAKAADQKFAKDPVKAIKAMKTAAKEAGNPAWAKTSITEIEKGIKEHQAKRETMEQLSDFLDGAKDLGGVQGDALSALGLVILLHMVWKFLTGKKNSAPKV
jgi:hypothetical protein